MTWRNLIEAYWLKLRFNLKEEASKSYLNYFWWLLEPVLLVLVFYLVFEIMLDRGGENFLLFLLCGKIPFLWFSKSVSNSANSILAGRGLINQMAIPKPFFPALVVGQDLVKQLFVMTALAIFVALSGFTPGVEWFVIPFIMFCQLLLITAAALIAAAVVPFIPDFKYIINTGMIMLMFGSGIFYDYRVSLNAEHQKYFLMNPLAQLIEAYRDILIRDSLPNFTALAAVSAGSVIAIGLFLLFFRRQDAAYARLVIQ